MILKLKKSVYFTYLKWIVFYPVIFAHKPLCSNYEQDVLHFGKVFLCRSCAFLYTGMLSSALIFFFDKKMLFDIKIYAFFILLLVLILSFPTFYESYYRKVKDILRFLTGFFMIYFLVLLFNDLILGLTGLSVLLIFWWIYKKLRPENQLCESCEEFQEKKICSGFILQADYANQFEEKASSFAMSHYKK